jgi:hypothetical protein
MLQHKRDIKDAAATAMATATFGGTMRNKPRWRQEGLIRRMISPTIFMPTMENAVALAGYGRKSGSIQYYPCEVVDY